MGEIVEHIKEELIKRCNTYNQKYNYAKNKRGKAKDENRN